MDLEELIKQKNDLYHELNMELEKPTELLLDFLDHASLPKQKSLNEHKEKVAELCYCLARLESKIAAILFAKGESENSVINLISQATYLTNVHEYEAACYVLRKAKNRTKKEAVIKHINEELYKLKQRMEKTCQK